MNPQGQEKNDEPMIDLFSANLEQLCEYYYKNAPPTEELLAMIHKDSDKFSDHFPTIPEMTSEQSAAVRRIICRIMAASFEEERVVIMAGVFEKQKKRVDFEIHNVIDLFSKNLKVGSASEDLDMVTD